MSQSLSLSLCSWVWTGSDVSEREGCWEIITVTRIGAGLLVRWGSQDNFERVGGVQSQGESGGVRGNTRVNRPDDKTQPGELRQFKLLVKLGHLGNDFRDPDGTNDWHSGLLPGKWQISVSCLFSIFWLSSVFFWGRNQYNKAIFIVFLALTGALGKLISICLFQTCLELSIVIISLSWSLKSFSELTQIYPSLQLSHLIHHSQSILHQPVGA